MSVEVFLGEAGGRALAIRRVDGQIDDVFLGVPEDAPPGPGAILRGRVDRPMKGQGGVFLNTPAGQVFLRQAKGLKQGACVLVQVTSWAEPGKAPPVTDRVLFKSRYCIVTPSAPGINVSRQIKDDDRRDALLELAHDAIGDSPFGLILRSAAEGAGEDDLADDIVATLSLAKQVMSDAGDAPEVLVDAPEPEDLAFREWSDASAVTQGAQALEASGVLDQLAEALSQDIALGAGGSMVIEPTRALVAVDVNTGSDGSLAAGLKANLSVARALPRALRLRGLGGQITLDLAPMPKKDRRQFESVLRASFRADPIETVLAGWTPLGHYELQRKRERYQMPRGFF